MRLGAGREEGAVDRGELQALLALRAIPGLGDRGVWGLVRRHGSGAAALRHGRGQTELWEGKGASGAPEEALSAWMDEGMRIRGVTAPDFPSPLLELTDPPTLLFLKGREELLARPGVAVVGARRATESGRRLAEALGRVLARAGIPLISGMALGIDGAAHRGALDAGGPTVAVLGSGLKVVYPPAHRGLFNDISEQGLLVTEFLPNDPALPHHFPRRNRIIAALARAVVVVEAGVRSGAFITVDHALDLGRDVMAFPGAVENPQARGTNRLLRDGARLLTHPEAILEELPWLGREGMKEESQPRDSEPSVPEELRPLWAALKEEPMEVERLARDAGLAAGTVAAGLTALELMGRVRRCPGMRFRRV